MKVLTRTQKNKKRAFALPLVMIFAAISLTALAGALTWTSTSARQITRNNEYYETAAAAEAASEKVLATLLDDYQNGSAARVHANMNAYRALAPTSTEGSAWSQFDFSDGKGTSGTLVEKVKNEQYIELDSQYAGLKGFATTYRIVSNARQKAGLRPITAAVGQDVQTASIPIFQYAIFYGLDLELHSLTDMDIVGRVHCNKNIYTYPSAKTIFWEDVTAAGNFIKTRKPGDPAYSTKPYTGSLTYKKKKEAQVSALTLPIGTNNTPETIRALLQPPPTGESVTSAMSRERFYNKAELVILVTNNSVKAFAKKPYGTTVQDISWALLATIVKTNGSFTDQREEKVVKVTEIDVSKLQAWSLATPGVSLALGINTPVNLIYVADNRKLPSTQLTAVRLINGSVLPTRGLTVATPNPLYVKGHYNQEESTHLGTTNTTKTKPAALISDALTVLSSTWTDAASANSYTTRNAQNMTLNAALLTGIVETSQSSSIYSGGAHNLARFLEDWDGKTFTYNGSMVVLYNSVRATKPFEQPGGYYYPPQRDYSFDLNFLSAEKLPPGTPELRGIIRDRWAQVTPGQTEFAHGF